MKFAFAFEFIMITNFRVVDSCFIFTCTKKWIKIFFFSWRCCRIKKIFNVQFFFQFQKTIIFIMIYLFALITFRNACFAHEKNPSIQWLWLMSTIFNRVVVKLLIINEMFRTILNNCLRHTIDVCADFTRKQLFTKYIHKTFKKNFAECDINAKTLLHYCVNNEIKISICVNINDFCFVNRFIKIWFNAFNK